MSNSWPPAALMDKLGVCCPQTLFTSGALSPTLSMVVGVFGHPGCCFEHVPQTHQFKAPVGGTERVGDEPGKGVVVMEVLVDRVAGLDVHKKTVTACVRVPGEGRSRVEHKARRFRRFGLI